MEKGDIYGLVGMATGIGATTGIVTYLIYANISLFASMMPLLMPMFYVLIFASGIVGVIFSIIGVAKNGSKFGIVGIITSILGMVIFILVLLY